MALNEYKEGLFIHDLVTADADIKLAESNLAHAEDTLDWARRMFDKGYVSLNTKVSEELVLKKARIAVEEAQTKRKVLIDYTKNKTVKALLGAVGNGPRARAAQAVPARTGSVSAQEARQPDPSLQGHRARCGPPPVRISDRRGSRPPRRPVALPDRARRRGKYPSEMTVLACGTGQEQESAPAVDAFAIHSGEHATDVGCII